MAELHIASCVARVRPEALESVIAPIEAIIGSAISARDAMGKLVIVIEGANTGALLDQMEQIRKLPGVLNVEMVYQHAEEESVMKELLP
jgi:periplasmic nitrate reductase NapD